MFLCVWLKPEKLPNSQREKEHGHGPHITGVADVQDIVHLCSSFSNASKCLSWQMIQECSSRLQGVHHIYITASVPTTMHPSIQEHHRPQPLNLCTRNLNTKQTSIHSQDLQIHQPPHKHPPATSTMYTPPPHPSPPQPPQPLTPPHRCTWTTQLLTTRNGRTTTKITVMVDCGKAYCFTSARFDRRRQQHPSSSSSSSRHSSSSGSRHSQSDGSSSRSGSSSERRRGGWKPWGF